MEDTYAPSGISGAFLILTTCSLAGIAASVFYSGYLAIAIGGAVLALALATKSFLAKRDRTVVFSLAGASILLGAGAIALGVLARILG